MYQGVRQRQIADRLRVRFPEILGRIVELREPVMRVDHRRDAVEAEAVEMELLHPILDVRQQEMAHRLLAVVEQLGIPERMIARRAGGRIEVIRPVELVEPFVQVLDIVRVNQIHDNAQTQAVRGPDQLLELLGRAEARRGREKIAHMVAEAPVIRMLSYAHQLDRVVSVALDARQHVAGELRVGTYARLLLRHAHMAFVDQQVAHRSDVESVALPVERNGRSPKLTREVFRHGVLNDAPDIGRYAFQPAVGAVHEHLDQRAVHEPVAEALVGQENAPDAVGILAQPQLRTLPAVEVAEQVDVLGPGQPLAEMPALQSRIVLKTVIEVAVGIIPQRIASLPDLVPSPAVEVIAAPKSAFVSSQPRVALDDRQFFQCVFHRCLALSLSDTKVRQISQNGQYIRRFYHIFV